MGTLHEDQFTFMMTSRWILLRMWKLSDKSCREKAHILGSISPPPENLDFYDVEKYCRGRQMTI